ncbi:MAG TPA: shikimate kinase AroK [Pseudomonadales bacterium]
MMKPSNIFFIGPMGAGKTTIGRSLANALQYEFVDSDHEIETRAGANIAWIFDVEGEEGFRNREEAVIDELSLSQGIVLATGGGAILRKETRQRLKQRGLVVYLKASAEQILKRTAKDKKRPLLQTKNRDKVVRELLKKRDPLYQEIADITIATRNDKISDVTQSILRQIKAIANNSD